MFLPLADTPNAPQRPWLTYALILANLVVYFGFLLPGTYQPIDWSTPGVQELAANLPEESLFYQRLEQGQATQRHWLTWHYGYRINDPRIDQIATSMFLHGSLLHLLSNMLFLFIFGDNVEHRLGRLRFLLLYFGCGTVGALFHTVLVPQSLGVGQGASAAICGVLGYYFLNFPTNRIRVLALFFPFFMGMLMIPARLVLGFYLLVGDLAPYLVSDPARGGAVHAVHLTGFILGLVLAAIGRLRLKPARPIETPP